MLQVWRVVVAILIICVLALAYRKYGDSVEHRRNVIQFGLGLAIALVLYYVSLLVLWQDKLVKDLRVDVRVPQRTKIIDGLIEVPVITDTVFETLDPRADSFVALPRSFNRQGGAQFTYQLWIFLDDVAPATVANKTILMRGDPKIYTWNDSSNVAQSGVAIACPSISFGDTYDQIQIRFNTLDSIGTVYNTKSLTTDPSQDPASRRQLLKLISKKWVLFTVVFEDNFPVSDFEDGVRLRFFLNDVLYDQATYPGKTLRQNNGQLILFPTLDGTGTGINKAKVADVSYYNYAVDAAAVKEVFDSGPPTHRSDIKAKAGNMGTPLYLSEYNKLDIYNT